MPRIRLKNLELAGYRSFGGEKQSLGFEDITVLLGANAAGKSNLVSFFGLLNFMTTGALQAFVAEHGYASSPAALWKPSPRRDFGPSSLSSPTRERKTRTSFLSRMPAATYSCSPRSA